MSLTNLITCIFDDCQNYYNFIMLNCKELQTIIFTLASDKVTELFCMTDDFCKFFDQMTKKVYAKK